MAGSEIVEDGRIDISLSFDSDNSSVIVSQLVIQELAFEDRGTYTCTATNTGGSDATTADLIVVGMSTDRLCHYELCPQFDCVTMNYVHSSIVSL